MSCPQRSMHLLGRIEGSNWTTLPKSIHQKPPQSPYLAVRFGDWRYRECVFCQEHGEDGCCLSDLSVPAWKPTCVMLLALNCPLHVHWIHPSHGMLCLCIVLVQCFCRYSALGRSLLICWPFISELALGQRASSIDTNMILYDQRACGTNPSAQNCVTT